jgi:uncharacterized protein
MSQHGPLEPFIATFTGGKAYPLGLRPEDLSIEDIAHSLSQLCRYNGHTSEFWSVAAHSLEVSRILEGRYPAKSKARLWLAGLLHDAGEAVLTDIPAPLKPMVINYSVWEQTVDLIIARKFGIRYPFPEVVREVDKDIVRTEVANFFPPNSEAWRRYGIESKQGFRELCPLSPRKAERLFLDRFHELDYWSAEAA